MAKQTLLEKALAIPIRNYKNGESSPEEIELAVAWLQGKITVSQIAMVMDTRPSTMQSKLSILLRDAYNKGKLVVRPE